MKNASISYERPGFGRALLRYFGVISAVLQREQENRRNKPLATIMALLEPILLVCVMSVAWYALNRRMMSPLGGSVVLFYATGFFANYFFIYMARRMNRTISAPTRRFPVETRLDHIFVHIILSISDYVVLGFVVFGGIALALSEQAIPSDVDSILLALGAIVMLAFGWGIVNLLLTRKLKFWRYIAPAINRSMVLFSGVIFVPDFLNPDSRYILSFNPMAHAISLFRMGFYPSYPRILLDTDYLLYCCVFTMAFGIVLERATRRSEMS